MIGDNMPKIHKFGDDIDTDIIIPARFLMTRDPKELAQHCMEPLSPNFASLVTPGDVMVAGRNFGCGSSREHAVLALRGSGISAVVAKSFARIFFRNAINQALPLMICPEAVEAAEDGGDIAIDPGTGSVIVGGDQFFAQPLPEFLRGIVSHGGLLPYVRQRIAETKALR
jgi:3-isopropylmalate/(R)-2-methylmalate dehydratase small subunit